jgi:hypothetical protein
MRLVNALYCLSLLASGMVVAADPASAAGGGTCTLPTYTSSHVPHPVLTARLNKDRTITFSGRTCPWAFIAVFQVRGHHLRNNAEDLVCDANPGRRGDFSCTSLRRYPNGSSFGVMISGQFIVSVAAPATRLPPARVRVHHERSSPPCTHPPRTGPNTGLGGLARLVVRHHPWRPARARARTHVRPGGAPRLIVSPVATAKGRSWTITIVPARLTHSRPRSTARYVKFWTRPPRPEDDRLRGRAAPWPPRSW